MTSRFSRDSFGEGASPPFFFTPLSSHKITQITNNNRRLERGYRGEVMPVSNQLESIKPAMLYWKKS